MKKIPSKQLTFSVAAFIISSSLLTKGLYSIVKNDAWISVSFGILTSLPMVQIYIIIAKKHPGLSLIEINDKVFGRILGKIISSLYVFYFLSLVILNTNDLGRFVKLMLLPNTPILVIYTVFVLVCAMAVRKGAVNMTRYGALFTYTSIMIIILNAVLLLNKVEPRNLLPTFTLPPKDYLLGTHLVTVMPFGDILIFMMFSPYMQNSNEFGKAMVKGLLIGGATLLFIVLRDIAANGKLLIFMPLPTFSTIRLINIGDVLTRLEIFYAVVLMMLYFFRVSTIYFATVSGVSKMIKFNSYTYLVLIIGALIVIYANTVFISSHEHEKWKMTAAATYATLFAIILPALTLSVSMIRDLMKKSGSVAA